MGLFFFAGFEDDEVFCERGGRETRVVGKF